jgi:hypothetical protein
MDIQKAYDEGLILRIHVMRPTWHFVLPEDVCWMTELTAPRVKAAMASSNRKLGLDETLFSKSRRTIAEAFRDHQYLTRQELKEALSAAGIETTVQTLAHIIMQVELDGLICSGPRLGKQLTYALLEARVAKPKRLNKEQALAALAQHYFTGHGPAQLEDFSWWSGLAIKEARSALDAIRTDLTSVTFNDRTYWYYDQHPNLSSDLPPAFLLSIYDEYTIAYKDRRDFSDNRDIETMIVMGNSLTAVIILNGKVAGTWSKALKRNTIEIKLSPFRKLNESEQEFLHAEIDHYSRFTGIPAVLVDPK